MTQQKVRESRRTREGVLMRREMERGRYEFEKERERGNRLVTRDHLTLSCERWLSCWIN